MPPKQQTSNEGNCDGSHVPYIAGSRSDTHEHVVNWYLHHNNHAINQFRWPLPHLYWLTQQSMYHHASYHLAFADSTINVPSYLMPPCIGRVNTHCTSMPHTILHWLTQTIDIPSYLIASCIRWLNNQCTIVPHTILHWLTQQLLYHHALYHPVLAALAIIVPSYFIPSCIR